MSLVWRQPGTDAYVFTIDDIAPVPASRPRVSKWGTYYGKTYKAYRAAMDKALEAWDRKPMEGALKVDLIFIIPQPKNPANAWPRGDIDNYTKAILDKLNGLAWVDDSQIVEVTARKVYGKHASTHVEIEYDPWITPDGD